MTLPVGITKCTVTVGPAYSFAGEEGIVSGSVVADRNVIWSATGAPIFKTAQTITPSAAGGQAAFVVPHVDQTGFVDPAGNDITGWYYTFNGRATFADGQFEAITKRFQVLVGQTTVDLDLVPDGPVIPGVTTPSAAVLSVNGQTGTVVIESGGLDDAGVAGRIADPTSATAGALATSYAHLGEDGETLVIGPPDDEVPVGGSGAGVDLTADLGPFAAGKGILLTSPDGATVVRLRVDNDGDIVTEDVGDPEPPGPGAPNTLDGLVTWFDTDSLSALTNGDDVTLWPDSSDSGTAAESGPGVAASPLYQTNGINGHPAVRFVAASGHALQVPLEVASHKPFTMLIALCVIDFADYRNIITGNGGTALRINQTTGLPNLDRGATSGIGTATTPLVANTAAVLTVRYDATGAWAFWINGTPAGSGVADNPLSSTVAALIGSGMNGWIGELVQYDTALDPTDRGAVEGYMIERWDIV